MSLCYREQRQLRGIQARLQGSDSHLAAMLEVFGRLYRGQDMSASEQVPSGHGRDRRAVTQIAAAFAAVALAISVMFSAALTLAGPGSRRSAEPCPIGSPAAPSAASDAKRCERCQSQSARWPGRGGHRGWRGLACVPALAIAGFTRIVRWPLILSVPKLAAEFSRAEGITIKLVIRGTSTGFADAW